MKVGVLQFFGWLDRSVPLPSIYDAALERIAIMDTTGYDAVWLAEHHFSGFSVCPSVHMMGVMAAARTRRLRIGTAVSLAPFYNPLRLAEEVALLDVLSGGRVNWGAGRGFERSEFKAFGIPGEESAPRFRETVDIVLKAWTSEKLSYQGTYYSYDGVEVLPKPLQSAAPAGVDGGNLSAGDRLGGGERLLDPDGPALVPPRSHRQAPLLRREARGRRPQRCRPGDTDGPPRRHRRYRREGARGGPARGAMDGGLLHRRHATIARRCGRSAARTRSISTSRM